MNLPAPLPANEAARLAELRRYEILDTPAEPVFDDFTKLAAQICGTPVALISLIDAGRQWFKSKLGVEITETARELSFCAHALEQTNVMEVPDAQADARFKENDFVTGDPNIRFYAGAPLITPAGLSLGTLCVLDLKPRHLTAEQKEALAALSRLVVNQLELRLAHRRERAANNQLDRLVTDRTAELRASDEHFRAMIKAVKDYAIITLDPEGRVISWNAGAERFKGYTAEEIQGKPHSIFYPTQDVLEGKPKKHLATAAREGRFEEQGWRWRKGGEPFWASVLITPLYDDSGKLRGFSKVTRDITEQRRVALALEESEERFRQLAEQSSDGFWFVRAEPNELIYVNPGVEKILGVSAAALYADPLVWHKAYSPEDLAALLKASEDIRTGARERFELDLRVLRPDGEIRWARVSGNSIRDREGKIVRLGGTMKDITENRLEEARRLRSQRVESIGTLAGGIAHDLNNALAPILMGAQLLRMQYPEKTDLIDTMERSATRGAGMVRQLLTFAKGIDGERVVLQPRHLLREMQGLIENTFPKNIELRAHFAEQLGFVSGDPTQLHQVLLNLCVNARDAMPRGGALTLSAENREVARVEAPLFPQALPGAYVVFIVQDTGTGIPPEVLDRIFEPFFSTKGPDQGTGLGLSTVMGIVKSHGGFVEVDSRPGTGSTFSIYLPAHAAGAEQERSASVAPMLEGRERTVLIVEDEASVRQMMRSVLSMQGFRVITAVDGTDGLIRTAEHRTEICLAIVDMHMPELDGLQFARSFRRMLPTAGILVCSGRLEEKDAREFAALGDCRILPKPFSQEKLLAAVHRLLNKRP